MKYLPQILQLANVTAMVLVIIFVTLQNRAQGMSTVFGGSGSVVATRRGFEKWIFYATITVGILFVGLSIAQLLLSVR